MSSKDARLRWNQNQQTTSWWPLAGKLQSQYLPPWTWISLQRSEASKILLHIGRIHLLTFMVWAAIWAAIRQWAVGQWAGRESSCAEHKEDAENKAMEHNRDFRRWPASSLSPPWTHSSACSSLSCTSNYSPNYPELYQFVLSTSNPL
jgi:hypothetical protein